MMLICEQIQSHKDLPTQLLTSQTPLEAILILGSTGSTKASVTPVFDLTVGLEGVPDGYKAMDERTALKVLVTNG